MTAQSSEGLTKLLERVDEAGGGGEVSMGDIVEAFGRRAFGPLLVIVSLLAILPTGAIPGMGAITGALMLLFCLQLVFGKTQVWIPNVLKRQTIGRERLHKSVESASGFAKRVDRLLSERMERFVEPPFVNIMAAVGALLSLTMFLLIPVPFGAFPASIPLLFFGLGLAARDGLVILIGLVLSLGAVYAVWTLWPG